MLKFIYNGIILQEVPNEISIGITILGCPHHCEGCHSSQYWDINLKPGIGEPFLAYKVNELLYNSAFPEHKDATCVCFFGGDWEMDTFIKNIFDFRYKYSSCYNELKMCNYKLAWYTSLTFEQIPRIAFDLFEYIKVGHYDKNLGGLDSPNTNQVFYERKFEGNNSYFIK